VQHPRSSTILHNPTAERDVCSIGFVADAKGRPAREIVAALLEGLRRVEHRGATAADGKTGDGAGVLLPISPALVPSPGCGPAMVFPFAASLRMPTSPASASRARAAPRVRIMF